jgi:hypothetical protein
MASKRRSSYVEQFPHEMYISFRLARRGMVPRRTGLTDRS